MRKELLEAVNSNLVQDVLQSFEDKVNLWKGTEFEFYFTLHNTQQGKFGEAFVSAYMRDAGSIISGRNGSMGHDKTIDGMKVEIKFSLQKVKPDDFVFNHISVGKDWERIIFCGLNVDLDSSVFVWCDKEDFANHIRYAQNSGPFQHAQGGNAMNNDDFIISGPVRVREFMRLPFVKPISAWTKPSRGVELFLC